jgi:hypothetical protein
VVPLSRIQVSSKNTPKKITGSGSYRQINCLTRYLMEVLTSFCWHRCTMNVWRMELRVLVSAVARQV